MRMQSPVFPDHVAIVTGAGRGPARHIALSLAREGARVVVADTGNDPAGAGGDTTLANRVVEEIVNSGGEAIAYTGALTDATGARGLLKAAMTRYGRVDALVHCADSGTPSPLLEASDQAWQRMVVHPLTSAFHLCRAFVQQVTADGSGGRIVVLLPAPPVAGPETSPIALSASMGLTGLTLAIAREYQGKGVTANAVAAVTPAGAAEQAFPTEQIVSMVLYLAAEDGKETTGEVFGVDGQHLFAYKQAKTPGVRKYSDKPWTPSQVFYRMRDIKTMPQPRKPPNPALKSSGAPQPAPLEKPAPRPKPRRKSTPIEEEPFLPPGPGATSSDPVERTFGLLPLGFRQSKAPGKSFHIYFDIQGGPGHTVKLEKGKFSVHKGKVGDPRCVVSGPADVIVGMFTGTINAEKAFVSGQLTTTNLAELMALGMVLDPRKAALAFKKGLVPEPASPETPAPSEATAPTAPSDTQAKKTQTAPTDPVRAALERLPDALIPEKAAGKSFNIFFDLKDGPAYSLILDNGVLRVEEGKVGAPSCIVRTDAETIAGVFSGAIKAEAAFMQGRFTATNLTDMMTLSQVISIKKAIAGAKEKAAPEPEETQAAPTDPVRTALERLPDALIPEKAAGKSFNIFFDLKDGPAYSLILDNGVLRVEEGKVGAPSCIVRTDAETIAGVFSGAIKAEAAFMQGRFTATNLTDMMTLNQVLAFKRLR